MEICKSAKVGITIEIIALVIMILLVLLNKTIPNILVWIFSIGLVIALGGSLLEVYKKIIKNKSVINSSL
jgi:hypothetical protein